MVIYSKELVLICNSWLTFLGYSNKVTHNHKGSTDDGGRGEVAMFAAELINE